MSQKQSLQGEVGVGRIATVQNRDRTTVVDITLQFKFWQCAGDGGVHQHP